MCLPIVTQMTDRVILLRGEATRFADAVERGPLDAPVVACPGWDVRRLAEHLGAIHRWARYAAANGAPMPPEEAQAPPDDPDELRRLGAHGRNAAGRHAGGPRPRRRDVAPVPVPKRRPGCGPAGSCRRR